MTTPKLVIAGASGVVGRHLIEAAKDRYDITILTRKVDDSDPPNTTPVAWNPSAAKEGDEAGLDAVAQVLNGAAALVNLAGASIDGGRLDAAHRRRVLNSRVQSTATLVAAFGRAAAPPPAWFNASAVGYYGDRGDEVLVETSAPQPDFFLSQVAQAWEAAAQPVASRTRLTLGRIGLVLAKDAPAWQKLVQPVKFLAGGPLGSGRQWYAWIDADDLAKAILFLLSSEAEGVYNLTAPNPVRQLTLTQHAAKKLGRPAVTPAPAFALRLILGDLADALLLASTRAVPSRLEAQDFTFDNPTLEQEMNKLFG